MVHILGYIAQTKDSGPRPIALSGLEKQLDDQLLGHNGIREYRKRQPRAHHSPPRIPASRMPWTG